jgi:hypothetical protein
MEHRIPTRRERGDAAPQRQLIRDLEEARSLALQAEHRELAARLERWMERLERENSGTAAVSLALSDCDASELWLG